MGRGAIPEQVSDGPEEKRTAFLFGSAAMVKHALTRALCACLEVR